jgi:hypothetical protein
MPTKSLQNIGAFLLILLVAGLTDSHSRSAETQENVRQPEVKVISNARTPVPPSGQRKKLVFEEVLSIGQIEGDDHYMFGETDVFNTDEQGNFYIPDWRRRRVLKYDSAGRYLLTIGREGQGPGEFQNLSPADTWFFFKNGKAYAVAEKDGFKFVKRYGFEIQDY